MKTTDIQCASIRKVWDCNTLEKAEAFINAQGNLGLEIENFIANDFAPTSRNIETINPKTGKVFGKVPITTATEVERALQTATEAFKTWRQTSAAVRSKYLQRVAMLIRENRELFAVWESIDQGKTLERARVEVDRAVSNFR